MTSSQENLASRGSPGKFGLGAYACSDAAWRQALKPTSILSQLDKAVGGSTQKKTVEQLSTYLLLLMKGHSHSNRDAQLLRTAGKVVFALSMAYLAFLGSKAWHRPSQAVKPVVVDLDWIRSSHECPDDDGTAAHRVCLFQNLVVYQSQLVYLYQGPRPPEIPDILLNWHMDLHLDIVTMSASPRSRKFVVMKEAQVQHIKVSTLTWRQYHLNYYHGMGEAVIDIYNLACKYLQYCGTPNSSEMTPIYIEKPGDQMSWEQALPSAAQAMHCLFPGKAHWIGDSDIHDKVLLLETAVVGIGPYSRRWRGFPDQAAKFKEVYGTMDVHVADTYRTRLTQCFKLQYKQHNTEGPYDVTIVNRAYHKGRHIVNVKEVAEGITAMDHVKSTRVVYMEPLTFKQQIQVYADSQVLVMTHGAALINILFMPKVLLMLKGSAVVVYNWLQREHLSPHTWVTDYMADLHLNVNFVGVSTQDRRHLYPQKEKHVFQPEYASLPDDEKVALLERGLCPSSHNVPGCDDMHMNFAVEWNLLQPAMVTAFASLQHVASRHALDGATIMS
ncbi:hypothetical protein WJX79_009020 [Trebouxia sp. C0005]